MRDEILENEDGQNYYIKSSKNISILTLLPAMIQIIDLDEFTLATSLTPYRQTDEFQVVCFYNY